MDIGSRIKDVRKYRKMTQQELADGVGVKKAIISLYESNQRKPSFEALEAIADTLNIDMAYLFGETSLSISEIDLVNHYRMSSEAGRSAISAFADTIAKGGM